MSTSSASSHQEDTCGRDRPPRPSAVEWRESDREDRTASIAFEQELALMLSDNSVRHEESESRPAFFCGEVWLEKMVAIFIGYSRAVV